MEGNKKNKARALLVFGAPGSGKTTFAEKFANKYGLAYYDLDLICEEHGFSSTIMLDVLSLIARTHQSVVLEGLMNTEKERTELRNALRSAGYEPTLIWVQTDFATIKMRLKKKYRSIAKAKEVYEQAVSMIEAPADFEKPVILSGKHTFETQTRHALAGLAELDEAK